MLAVISHGGYIDILLAMDPDEGAHLELMISEFDCLISYNTVGGQLLVRGYHLSPKLVVLGSGVYQDIFDLETAGSMGRSKCKVVHLKASKKPGQISRQ